MSGARCIRVLIVDDESLARERIRDMLDEDPEIEALADCSNGQEALEAIKEHAPDLVFLDVEMPGMNGFAVLEALQPATLPVIIFVTAYDQYAVKAFEVYALDYLLKPFDRQRFNKALQRAKSRLQPEKSSEINQRTLALLEELKAQTSHMERLIIKSGGRAFFLK